MSSVTLADLKDRVYNRLEGNSRLYPASAVTTKINEGLRVTNLFCGWNSGKSSAGLTVVGRTFYRTPTDMIIPTKVFIDGAEAIESTAKSITGSSPRWMVGDGKRSNTWVPIGLRTFALVDPPKFGGRQIDVYGVKEPVVLVNDADTTELRDQFVELVSEYAFFSSVIREPGKVFLDASRLYNPWLKKLSELKMWRGTVKSRYWVDPEKA